jgi:glutamine amidotransferase
MCRWLAYSDSPIRLEEVLLERRLVVSDPLGDLEGAGNEVPESRVAIVQQGADELRPFTPRSP